MNELMLYYIYYYINTIKFNLWDTQILYILNEHYLGNIMFYLVEYGFKFEL